MQHFGHPCYRFGKNKAALAVGAVEFWWQVLRLSIYVQLPTQPVLSRHMTVAFISTLHILFMFAFHASPPSIHEGQMKLKAEVNGSKEE